MFRSSARKGLARILSVLILNGFILNAQQQVSQQPINAAPIQAQPSAPDTLRPNYVLGPGDQILIRAFELEEIGERPMLIDGDGNVNIPLIGVVHAAGLTVSQLEANLITLIRKYVKQPRVTVTIVQFRSEPVFFVGAFQKPGIYPLQGRRTLVEMLTAIGGLQPNASRFIKVSRRKDVGSIPLSNATLSPDGKSSTVRISLGSLRDNVNPAEDIVLEPFDVITAEKAELIYVNGEINKVGGIDLLEKDSMSITQVVTVSGGLKSAAAPTKARILRPVINSPKRAEIPINVTRIMEGKDNDFPVLPNDVLYIPAKSGFKRVFGRAALIALPVIISITVLLARR